MPLLLSAPLFASAWIVNRGKNKFLEDMVLVEMGDE